MKLCLTLAESSPSALQEKVDRFDGRADLIEIRLDFLDHPAAPRLPGSRRSRYIATCRPIREGGRFQGRETERLQVLRRAVEAGYDWIDVEYDVDLPFEVPSPTRIIRSHHIFDEFPADLDRVFRRVCKHDGLAKLAVAVSSTRELARLLEWMGGPLSAGHERVIIGMGELGQPSRYLGSLLGNAWTYVCESGDRAPAPGQFSLQEGRSIDLRRDSRLYGVIGKPVEHSLSPQLHNELFRRYEQPGAYIRLPLDDLEAWFEYCEGSPFDFRGYSVTLPFKQEILPLCRRSTSPVDSINTLNKTATGLEGTNTDYGAFLAPLKSRYILEGTSAVVLGNGGVAHTVVGSLQREGVEVVVAGRNPQHLDSFASLYDVPWCLIPDLRKGADLLVNTTPVGQYPDVDDSPLSNLDLGFRHVYDLIYNPERTRLLEEADARGCQIISGIEMFAEQGAQQFNIWTGLDPDRAVVGQILREILS